MNRGDEVQFRRLLLSDWRQFHEVSLDFHPNLTVLTGANASGKTTILGVLARHFQWSWSYSVSPYGPKARKRWSSRRAWRAGRSPDGWHDIGSLTYTNGMESVLQVPDADVDKVTQYQLQIAQPAKVTGMFIASHRAVTGSYSAVQSIPTVFDEAENLFQRFAQESRQRWVGNARTKPANQTLKEALIAAAVFGEGSRSVVPNPEAIEIWRGFQQVLRQMMPETLGFRRLRIEVPEVIVESESGDFIIDEMSGGLSAIVEMAWQIFLRSRNHDQFTALIDEPENHLHPSLQRDLMPRLLEAFPRVQFIVATHSPFVVTAAADSAVYALDYYQKNRVVSHALDYANKAASADDTLRRVLGVESVLPRWAERRFRELVNEFASREFSTKHLDELRHRMDQLGLGQEFSRAVLSVEERAEGKGSDG